jgi:molybdenum cofactor biosynthesis protein B
VPQNIAVMTVSDTRTDATDKSGDTLAKLLAAAGHTLSEKRIVPDDIYQICAVITHWIAEAGVNAVITTGGTRITGRDSTPGAIAMQFDKRVDGFGEVFRAVSCEEINISTIQSRAIASVANATRTYLKIIKPITEVIFRHSGVGRNPVFYGFSGYPPSRV